MFAQILRAALTIAAQEIRAELRERRNRGQTQARPALDREPAYAVALCEECGRAGKRACPKCNRQLCGRCACPCRHQPAQSMVVTRAPTITPAPSQSRPPQTFGLNHRIGLGTVAEAQWHDVGQCWTYLIRWSNGASAWMMEKDLLRYTKIV